MTRSGLYFSRTSFKAVPKSPTKEQQIQPEFISVISIPASFKKPPSTPISPNSFSIRTSFSPANASFKSFLIRVVLPAPRKPDTISIFVISSHFLSINKDFSTKSANFITKGERYTTLPHFNHIIYLFNSAFAVSANTVKAAASLTAKSARTFLFISTPANFKPCMNLLYDKPFILAAALIRAIHNCLN